ncbi:EGF-like repeat and discoidin I-like domain-containing protein 3 [Exaiptasia diaphana]|uniref:Lactadherin-like n=1 Tax=Exaiptasia diaphana TaxID=2652724 RepID=A0A913YMZ7_EXADI|nr:EGF-like repeat and discoidin I-like domain-containing protein 3 [Exaiptasia diaphana]
MAYCNKTTLEYFTVCDLSPCQNGGSCNEQGGVHTCNCTYYFYGANCEKGCNVTPPVGMENGAISNSSITASTEYSSNFAAWSGRLRHLWSSWSPSTGRAGEWLQVDLGKTINVTGVATQGHPDASYWVTVYRLTYKRSASSSFKNYKKGVFFIGNTDRSTVVKHDLSPLISARYVRLIVIDYKTWPALRIEIYGPCL